VYTHEGAAGSGDWAGRDETNTRWMAQPAPETGGGGGGAGGEERSWQQVRSYVSGTVLKRLRSFEGRGVRGQGTASLVPPFDISPRMVATMQHLPWHGSRNKVNPQAKR
jgi:hypothetical protein